MSNKFKLIFGISYVIILCAFLYFLFINVEINRLNDFTYYKELQFHISNLIGTNLYLNLLIFFLFTVFWILLLGFGSPILLMSGILFGKWIGTLVSLVSITLGALLLYIIANFFFKELIKKLLENKFSKYFLLFKKNEFYYFFAFRFVGGLGIPFGLQNVLPVLFNISKLNYFIASFFGFVPNFFIWNTIGSGINQFIETNDSFSFFKLIQSNEIMFPLGFFVIIIIIAFIIRRKVFNV